ncbi:hypothetical protein A0J61_11357, partial [Choanephora cucurbitarum]
PAAVANRPSSVLESSTSTSAFAHRQDDLLHHCIRPFIQGLEDDSTLIDITNIRDLHELKQFFGSFNTETDFPYFGALLVERRYLQRRFIETFWDKTNAEYEKLLGNGLTMDDGTIIKGYPSLPSNAKVARVKVERLSFINPLSLRDLMFKRFAHFGTVLDAGLQLDGKSFFGQGYVILDLNRPHPTQSEFLRREIDWFNDDDRCRADCPDLHKSKQCYHCNDLGHISKDCLRRGHNPQIPPNKRVAITKAQMEKEAAMKAAARTEKLRQQRQAREEEDSRISAEKTQALFSLEERIQNGQLSTQEDDLPDVPMTHKNREPIRDILEAEIGDSVMGEAMQTESLQSVSDNKKIKVSNLHTTITTDGPSSSNIPMDSPRDTSRRL